MKKKPPHVCEKHEHSTIHCGNCASIRAYSLQEGIESLTRIPPTVVYRVPEWAGIALWSMVGWTIGCAYIAFYKLDKPPIHDGGYPVYHTVYTPDPQLKANWKECHGDYETLLEKWKEDQITKEIQRIKIKRLEAR